MNLPDWWLRVSGWATSRRRRRTGLFGSAERFEARTLLASFLVNSPLDQPDASPGDGAAATASGETTLRAAIQEANAAPGPDTIILPPGLLNLTLFEPDGHTGASGHLEVSDELIIVGADRDSTLIDASQIDSVFHIQAGVSLTLDQLTLQIPAGSEAATVEDGGSLELDDAVVDEVSTEAFPIVRAEDLTVNDRHSSLLASLYNPVVSQEEPLDPVFAPPPVYVSILNSARPDATIAIGSERTTGWLSAETDPELQPAPNGSRSRDTASSARIAERTPDEADDSTNQRRRDVVNSLFQNAPGSRPQSVKPVAGEQPEDIGKEPRRLHEKFPLLLPMNPEESGAALPEHLNPGVPLPPPLPEPAVETNADSHTRRATGRSGTAQALMAGVLLTMASPNAIRRAVKRITGWKNLVV